MRALLDVNILIALLDAEHLHHESARSLSGIRSLQPRINNLQTRDGS